MNEEDKSLIVIHAEVLVSSHSTESFDRLELAVKNYLETSCTSFSNGPISYEANSYLVQNVSRITICDIPDCCLPVPFWKAQILVHLYSLNTDSSVAETLDGACDVTAYNEWMLPCVEFDHLWDHLVYDGDVKADLLNYATSAFFFSQHQVDNAIISLNRLLLLHGPPGTGKTSLCKSLAQKLAIRYFAHYHHIALIEINSHSLFSKWFSESGKLVMKLFDYIHDLLAPADTLLFILIDEVESLSASRKASLSGAEPSDGMRVVNALLTQIDKLRNNPSVLVLTTSNLSGSIDDAFIDRADIKRFIGNPGAAARFAILHDCLAVGMAMASDLQELLRTGIVVGDDAAICDCNAVMRCEDSTSVVGLLRDCVLASDGLSGRALRKLPFQAYARWLCGRTVGLGEFLAAMKRSILVDVLDMSELQIEKEDRERIVQYACLFEQGTKNRLQEGATSSLGLNAEAFWVCACSCEG